MPDISSVKPSTALERVNLAFKDWKKQPNEPQLIRALNGAMWDFRWEKTSGLGAPAISTVIYPTKDSK